MTYCNKCTNDSAIEHSTGCLYEHFLSYMNTPHSALLCKAYFDGRNVSHEEYEAYMKEHPVVPQGEWVDLTRDAVESLFWPWKAKTEYEIPLFEYRVIAAEVIAKFKEKNTPPSSQRADALVEAAMDWSNLKFQYHALQQIGGYWYDGPVRNQWIADNCHEMTKHIAAAIR